MTTQHPDSSSVPAADSDDWLGYSAYADALWSRVVRALDKDKGGKPLGDDPLVVGIFGEWGAGKSHLLKLVYRRAEAQSNLDIARRVLHAAADLTVPLTVTVPVMFQPWKYEHEPHLHVPLAIHVADALEEAWKKLPTDFEHVKVFVDKAAKALESTEKTIQAASGVFSKMMNVWQGAQKAVHSEAAKVVAGTLDVAAISVGIPPVLTLGLGKAREHLDAPEDGEERESRPKGKGKGKEKPEDEKPATASNTSAEKRETSFSHSENGLAFYRIHKLMQAMTRPKLDAKTLEAAGLKIGKQIEFDLRINFAVFVDDLDRCLPEKAVETLELIKTTFNIESFAFVLALDDEVIERGIGHRYKEYQLVGKKPEMPITGFEYLEKIVHVPFRLPALTRAQASEFVRQYERDIEPEAALRWFEPVQPHAAAMGGNDAVRAMQRPDLLELALSGFDAFMPRKLIRMVELLHQVAKIAAIRNAPLQVASSGGVDVRVVLTLLLIQLFQPELHRILRRRDESFPVLLAAFANKEDGTKDGSKELYDSRVSDIDLWQWAVHAAHVGQRDAWNPPDFEKSYGYAVQQIGLTHKDDSFERVNAQIVRLPLVAQIISHRAVNRHVFDVLKLVTALAASMGGAARALTISPYFSLLSQTPVASTGLAPMEVHQSTTGTFSATVPAAMTDSRLRFDTRNVEDLADILLSADEAVQANMASRIDLREGEVLAASSAAELVNSLRASFATLQSLNDGSLAKSKLNLLSGLRYLAPYLALVDAKSLWELVKDSVDFNKVIEPKTRALWGDVRSLLGCDDRFDPERPYLFKTRFSGHTEQDEPIPGFVRIPAGDFQMGGSDVSNNLPRTVTIREPFYICRTLVTVQQYSKFIDADGYVDNNAWWDKQGVDWRKGLFDSKVKNEDVKSWLASRSVDLRKMPMDWAAQNRLPSRPVVNVSWFEARAYARWLSEQMRGPIAAAKLEGYQVLLPTEDQWERAARAASTAGADARKWPWSDDEKLADQRANLSQTVGSVCAVGLYRPNPIGLYDMAGNAWEWMDNLYQPKPDKMLGVKKDMDLISRETMYKSDTPTMRGGSWFNVPDFARCSYRSRQLPDDWINAIGFRVVLSLAI